MLNTTPLTHVYGTQDGEEMLIHVQVWLWCIHPELNHYISDLHAAHKHWLCSTDQDLYICYIASLLGSFP